MHNVAKNHICVLMPNIKNESNMEEFNLIYPLGFTKTFEFSQNHAVPYKLKIRVNYLMKECSFGY